MDRGLRSGKFNWLSNRRIIVLRLVHSCRDRPHPHGLGRERSHQVTRIGLLAEPAGVVAGRKDDVINNGSEKPAYAKVCSHRHD